MRWTDMQVASAGTTLGLAMVVLGAGCGSPRPEPAASPAATARAALPSPSVASPPPDPRPVPPQPAPNSAWSASGIRLPAGKSLVRVGQGGVGFIVGERLLVTTAAFVSGSLSVRLDLPGVLSGDVVAEDEPAGVVLVSIDSASDPPGTGALPVASAVSLLPGEQLRLQSRPEGIAPFGPMMTYQTWGAFRGLRFVDHVIYLDAEVQVDPHAAGGPVLDQKGRVVGVAVRRRFEKTCYLVAADHILALLQKRPAASPTPEPVRAPTDSPS